MRRARIALLGALAGAAVLSGAMASAAQASFGVAQGSFEAGTCKVRECEYASPHSQFFTQAAGHPEWGITSFELNHTGSGSLRDPEGQLKRIRVDVPPGLAADPQAPLPACAKAQFEANPSGCPEKSKVGEVEMEAVVEVGGLPVVTPALSGVVYNLELSPGLPLDFGIAVEPLAPIVSPVHLFLEGHVSDAYEPVLAARGVPSGDYHEYFEINNVPTSATVTGSVQSPLKVLKSKLLFDGRAGGDFLTLPSVCSSSTTSYIEVESYEGRVAATDTHTPVGVEGCDEVPFAPTAGITAETSASDLPDGATVEVKVPQNAGAQEINTADIRDAHVTLPEGLTLDPPAAHGLATCSPAQIGIGAAGPVGCPPASQVGTVAIETDLPPHSLTGSVYLGDPAGGPITGPPFTIYLDAESVYGVSVRLKGLLSANPGTGRLEATFTDNPELPFSDLILKLDGGPRAALANPLACGSGRLESLFTPYTGGAAALSSSPFVTTGCPNPPPFSLSQSTQTSSPTAGAYTSFTFSLARADGQQYVSGLTSTLPAGLLGAIPSVTLCGEPQAAQGSCGQASEIGLATVTAGAGSEPYAFSGPVYLTGPYDGAPYGLSIPVAAIAGPFDFGTVLARAAISVDPHSARVIVASSLPKIVRGVPLRLRSISVAVNRPKFIFNPTNCGPLHTDTTLSGFATLAAPDTATEVLASPFQVGGCGALAFKPTFKVATSAHHSKAGGASLRVTLAQPAHEANLSSVLVQLPKRLPTRLTTLQKACPEATFAASPLDCRALGSEVGTASATTPVLPGRLHGSAYLVSHGGEAFPDLDLVLEGDGVRVILTGKTRIEGGITSSNFASIPDVPVSRFVLDLPVGPHSALTAIGNLCTAPLFMPTTLTAQSGARISRRTRISVGGCGVRILGHRVRGRTLILRIRTPLAGRVIVGGSDLSSVRRRYRRAKTFTVKLRLARAGVRSLARHGRLRLRVRVRFAPRRRALPSSSAATTARFTRGRRPR